MHPEHVGGQSGVEPGQPGQEWTQWTSCLRWAEALVDWVRLGARRSSPGEDQRTTVIVLLARAIASEARERGITAARPDDLCSLNIPNLYVDKLDRARIAHDLVSIAADGGPADGEPGIAEYDRLCELDKSSDEWHMTVSRARAVLMSHIVEGADSLHQRFLLGQRRDVLTSHRED